MICTQCDQDMAQCTCPDLEERFKSICQSPFIHIGEEYKDRIRAHIAKTKGEQTKTE